MKLSCSSQTIKYLMFAFNLFFVLSGIIIIAVGAAVKTKYTEYAEFLDGQYFSLPNMLIATGAFIFIISFFGCCGAIKESWVMLGIFSLLLCIIFIFEFASGIAGYVLRNKTADYLDDTLRKNLATYNQTHDVWDLIQSTFHCCGVDSYEDWKGRIIGNDSFSLPISCCKPVSGTTGAFYCNAHRNTTTSTPFTEITTEPIPTASPTQSTTSTTTTTTTTTTPPTTSSSTSAATITDASAPTETPPKPEGSRRKRDVTNEVTPSPTTSVPYSEGCKSAFGNYIKEHVVQIGGCALGLAIVQILGIAFSCHLVRQLKNGYYST